MGRRRSKLSTFPSMDDHKLIILPSQDTFVVGCKFSDKIIYPHTFEGNPDSKDAVFSTECGIYEPHCGMDNVMLSWGHDEVRFAHVTPSV